MGPAFDRRGDVGEVCGGTESSRASNSTGVTTADCLKEDETQGCIANTQRSASNPHSWTPPGVAGPTTQEPLGPDEHADPAPEPRHGQKLANRLHDRRGYAAHRTVPQIAGCVAACATRLARRSCSD